MIRPRCQWHPGEERANTAQRVLTGCRQLRAAGLDMSGSVPPPRAAAYKVVMRKQVGSSLSCSWAMEQSWPLTLVCRDLPVVLSPESPPTVTFLPKPCQSSPESDRASSVPPTSAAPQALPRSTAGAQPCLRHTSP